LQSEIRANSWRISGEAEEWKRLAASDAASDSIHIWRSHNQHDIAERIAVAAGAREREREREPRADQRGNQEELKDASVPRDPRSGRRFEAIRRSADPFNELSAHAIAPGELKPRTRVFAD